VPPPRRRKPRALKCAYRENGRRCPRDADPGRNPPLCRAHWVSLGAAAEQRRQPGAGLGDVIDSIVNGKPISTQGIVDAIGDLIGAFARPPPPYVPNQGPSNGAWWEPIREQARARAQQPPPPPRPPGPSPEDVERARRVFGFNGEPITKDELRKRYRKLALKYHPDRKGGSVSKMSELNRSRDLLEAGLR
jgi:hypothetical protein